MNDLTNQIQRVLGGEIEAFNPVVKQFQDMAVGYAYAILGDFHAAEDAAQNAFLTAFLNLESVRDAKAFPGWIRRIVFTECNRMTRGNQPTVVDVVKAETVPSGKAGPEEIFAATEAGALTNELISELPDRSREVLMLYYLADMSQKEIADFLGTSEGTVKKRLHDAREKMRKGMEQMAIDDMKQKRPSRDDRFSESVVATVTTAFEAVTQGDCNRLKALLEAHPTIVEVGGALDFRYGEEGYFSGATLLHCLAGHPTPHNPLPDNALEVMKMLLDAGTDPNVVLGKGGTMLGLICWRAAREKGVLIDMIDMLVEYGADPNAGFDRGSLENALWHGETDAGHALLRHGSKYDLRIAAGLGRIDLIEEFMEADGRLKDGAYALAPPMGEGCKRDLSDQEVLTDALSMAVLNWQFDTVDYLLEKGADINGFCTFVHGEGITALHHVCSAIPRDTEREDPKMVAFLLDRGADPTILNGGVEANPFAWAVHNELPAIASYLVERDAAIGDLAGMLRFNVGREKVKGVKWLLEAGADPDELGPTGKSAIDYARQGGNQEIIELFEKHVG